MTEAKTILGNGIKVEGELNLTGSASPVEDGSHTNGDNSEQEAELPAPRQPKPAKKPPTLSFGALEQAVDAIEARQEEEAESAERAASIRDFLAKLPDLSAKLTAAQYKQGGQGKIIGQQILHRSDLKSDPVTQFHARAIHITNLAVHGAEHGAVPDFDSVMLELAVKELALFEEWTEKPRSDSESSGKGQPEKRSRKNVYIIGEVNYTLSPKMSVSEELRKFVEIKVIPSLNALYHLSVEKARKEREAERKNFESGVTITPVELYAGVPGVSILDVPPRKVTGYNPQTKENYTIMQPGGQVKVRSDGQDVWALDARFSQGFVEKMGSAIQGVVKIALCDILEQHPPLQFTDPEKRKLSDETKRTMRWFHGALCAHWDKLQIMRNAREQATITPEEFVLRPGVEGTVFVHLKTFRWKVEKPDGTQILRHYADLWALLTRDAKGNLMLTEMEYDPYAFGLLDDCMGTMRAGDNYAGVKNPLRMILRLWSGVVTKAAKEELDPERQKALKEWIEEGKEAAGHDQAREDYFAKLTPEERERALDAEQKAKSDYGEPDIDEPTEDVGPLMEGIDHSSAPEAANDPENGSKAESGSPEQSAAPEVPVDSASEKSSGPRESAKSSKSGRSPRKGK